MLTQVWGAAGKEARGRVLVPVGDLPPDCLKDWMGERGGTYHHAPRGWVMSGLYPTRGLYNLFLSLEMTLHVEGLTKGLVAQGWCLKGGGA